MTNKDSGHAPDYSVVVQDREHTHDYDNANEGNVHKIANQVSVVVDIVAHQRAISERNKCVLEDGVHDNITWISCVKDESKTLQQLNDYANSANDYWVLGK